jgi:hypothetical protein
VPDDDNKYRDISWLMPFVDVREVLEKLGVERISSTKGREVDAMCPDHHLFVGHEPSHVKWSCNIDTGWTYCFTEGRGSNLLWTVTRMMDCTADEAVKFMTGSDASTLRGAAILGKIKRIKNPRPKKDDEKDPVRLDDMKEDLKNRFISDMCYEFFMNPPGKSPTNIERETVDRFRVFERKWGYYSNRAIVPFFMHGELVGFCAIDMLGKKKWLMEHPLEEEGDYRKTLYPLNFRGRECLFGYDDIKDGCELLFVTEGAREVMKLRQEGFDAVGCLKADLSDEQILLITKKAPKEAVMFFDGDVAGYTATDKVAKKLKKFMPTRKCLLPLSTDPKNFNSEEIKNIIKSFKYA